MHSSPGNQRISIDPRFRSRPVEIPSNYSFSAMLVIECQ
uniref:Uncharacterized protein n=1 Tax=Arundo donax TaxID=35708 RepID=A0A0A8YFN1_ARUDO